LRLREHQQGRPCSKAASSTFTTCAQPWTCFRFLIAERAKYHDLDKISDIDGFHRDFLTGFKQTEWWDAHRKINRHHLLQPDGVPK